MSKEPYFGITDAMGAFGPLEPEDMARLARMSIERGVVMRNLYGTPGDTAEPPDAILVGWSITDAGVLSLVAIDRDSGTNEFRGCWPFVISGTEHAMTVDEIHHDVDCPAITMLEGRIGHVPITVFDTFCDGFSDKIMAGETVTLHLAAWAINLRRASSEPMRIALDDIKAPQVREIFQAGTAKDGTIEIDTAGMVVFLPSLACSPLYELRTPIKAVYPGVPLLGMPVWILIVPFQRDDGESLDMELHVTGGIWEGPAPKIGDDVEGIIWVQARR